MLNRQHAIPTSIVEATRHWADQCPDKMAFTFLSGNDRIDELTFAGLLTRVEKAARALSLRVAAGDRALLLFTQSVDFVVAFVACEFAGVIPVPMSLPRGRERNNRLALVEANCTPSVILSHAAGVKMLADRGLVAPIVLLDELESGDGPSLDGRCSDIAFLQYTSGSTGNPKGVMVSQENILSNIIDLSACFSVNHQSSTVSWLPNYHDMGLVGTILLPLFNGCTSNLMAPEDFLRNPLAWLSAISHFKADAAGGPNFALELCAKRLEKAADGGQSLDDLDLSSWRTLFVGAEPVNGETLALFASAAAPFGFNPGNFLPCYGLAEATLFVTTSKGAPRQLMRSFDTQALQNGAAIPADSSSVPTLPPTSLVCCGDAKIESSTNVIIVNPDLKEELPDGNLGEIWLSGPSICMGYWPEGKGGDPEFQATVTGNSDATYYRTGDIGFIIDGRLYITGRLTDMIIKHGVNYYPTDLENAAAASDSRLPKWRSVAFSYEQGSEQRIVLIQEVPREGRMGMDMTGLAAGIRQSILDAHGLLVDDVVLLKPGKIPVTASGKVQRRRCRELYLSQEFENLAPSDVEKVASPAAPRPGGGDVDEADHVGETPITEALRSVLSSILNMPREKIDPNKPMRGFPLDSLRVVEAQMLLEARYGLVVTAEALQSATPLYLVSSIEGSGVVQGSTEFWQDAVFRDRPARALDPTDRGGTLVTGATGLVGSHLVAEIVGTTSGPIHCLVRQGESGQAAARLSRQLQAAGLDQAIIDERIFLLEGDISQPNLGLPPETYQHMSETIGTIYHNAADLDFLRPYQQLKAANVDGTRNILALAVHNRNKRVAHVSSVSVLEAPVRNGLRLDEETILDHPETLATGYAQSKWVADMLVLHARECGLDACIFRPPWILGSSAATSDASGFIARFLRTCVVLGAIPDSQFAWNIVTPGFVAAAIARGMEDIKNGPAVYHIGASAMESNGAFRKALGDHGIDLKLVPVEEWKNLFKDALNGNVDVPLQPLAPLFFQGAGGVNTADVYVDGAVPIMDSARTLAALEAVGVCEEKPDFSGFIRHAVLQEGDQ